MKLKKPKRLKLGDSVGIVAPASPPWDADGIDQCAEGIRKLGFAPVIGRHARKRNGYLAGTDAERTADLMEMFADPEIRAILCVRGGYGTARILDRLDYKLIRENPKPLVGFSDITSLHCALMNLGGVVSFHGPNILNALTEPGRDYAVNSLIRTLTLKEPVGDIAEGRMDLKAIMVPIWGGKASGPLIGGNLTVLNTMLGTAYQPTFRGRILFLEDVDEAPYRIDRSLTYLLNLGALDEVAGIVIGVCSNCEAKKPRPGEQTLIDVLVDRLGGLGVPVLAQAPFGHIRSNATLPVGIRATLNPDERVLSLDEPGVV